MTESQRIAMAVVLALIASTWDLERVIDEVIAEELHAAWEEKQRTE